MARLAIALGGLTAVTLAVLAACGSSDTTGEGTPAGTGGVDPGGAGGTAGASGGVDVGGTGGTDVGGSGGSGDSGGSGGAVGGSGGVDAGGSAGATGGTAGSTGGAETGGAGGSTGGMGGADAGEVFFDDFVYTSRTDPNLGLQGWSIRTGTGGPAMVDSSWLAENIDFLTEGGDTVIRLSAQTDGTPAGTSQAEISTPLKFLEGTYAARMRLTDEPASGSTDGDGIVEAFFTITSWSLAGQLDYGEIDFEYLANGGWGVSGATLWNTTWEQAEPADNVHDSFNTSYAGWHVLLFTVTSGEVRFYADGNPLATHGGEYYPETPMIIDLQIWFMSGALAAGNDVRTYEQDFDWVYHRKDVAMTTAEVEQAVADYRAASVPRLDTVAAN